MSEILEIVMLVAFGVSWPISLIKNIKSRSTKGVSILFYFLILFGYVAGIISKFTNEAYMASINEKWYVLIFYFFNFTVVGLNIIVYFRNKAIEAKEV
ncbi:MAG: hypothetical protein J5691_03350 [Bacilli bacterium]|nr:hypothetical protein [Bacilli bacterium]